MAQRKLTIEKARERVEELRAQIRHHDRLYYVDSAPEIDDRAYDRLAALHESQEHGLTEHEPVARIEVLLHALRHDHEPVEQSSESTHDVEGQLRGIRQEHPLDRRMRDVSLMPQRDVLESGQ